MSVLTILRKSMYMWANFNVSLLDSLSDGWVGTIPRSLENASFKLSVLCRSRLLAVNYIAIVKLNFFLK